jgi:ABC-type amino acid transport substrate-binding protein
MRETKWVAAVKRNRGRLEFWAAALLGGAVLGLLVLRPANDFVAWHEHEVNAPSAFEYVRGELAASWRGAKLLKSVFYAGLGALFGGLSAVFHGRLLERNRRIERLTSELQHDLAALVAAGESDALEFKSSWRWDVRERRTNRALETVVLKSLAGFLNGAGGTLLIGVADDGHVLGLENDYQTLKRQDRDGFDQALMGAVASQLGGDLAPQVQIVFHALKGCEVCRVIVAPAPRPVFLEQGGSPKLYLRAGAATRELNVKEAIDFQAARWP